MGERRLYFYLFVECHAARYTAYGVSSMMLFIGVLIVQRYRSELRRCAARRLSILFVRYAAPPCQQVCFCGISMKWRPINRQKMRINKRVSIDIAPKDNYRDVG